MAFSQTYLVINLDAESKTVALKLILVVKGLDDLQRAGAVVVTHHCELVSAVSAVLNHLRRRGERR